MSQIQDKGFDPMDGIYTTLKMAIARKGNQKQVAFELGISDEELSRFLNNQRAITIQRLEILLHHLGLFLSMEPQKEDQDLIRLLSKKLSEEMKIK
jgi:transcriptional regulator with XRE-family HTH domain